jgi:hypothetical protein
MWRAPQLTAYRGTQLAAKIVVDTGELKLYKGWRGEM